MPKKVPVPTLVRARVPENVAQKITVYAQRHNMTESAVIREAVKKFLRNVSTKSLSIPHQTTN